MGNNNAITEKDSKKELTHGARFTEKVFAELEAQGLKGLELSAYQKSLVYNTFISIDQALKKAEENRIKRNTYAKNKSKINALEYNWKNVNLQVLALDCAHYARLGLDMLQDNYLHAIPYKNASINKYEIGFIKGYEGLKYIAYEFAMERPVAVTTELIYSTDTFMPIKKGINSPIDTYDFQINNPFDRGNIIGGFGYIEYSNPAKNKLYYLSIKDIEKRKSADAPVEFWGGSKDIWEDGKVIGTKQVEGWFDEMCKKTMDRFVYSKIQLDPKKVNSSFEYTQKREKEFSLHQAQAEIEENANSIVIEGIYSEVAAGINQDSEHHVMAKEDTENIAQDNLESAGDPY